MNRRTATSVIFIGFFLLGMVFILWGIMLPDLAKSLVMSELVSGAFFTLISIGAITGAFVGGKYIQKFDFMSLFACLSLSVALLLVFMSSVNHWRWLLLGAFLLGFICSSLFTIAFKVVSLSHYWTSSVCMVRGTKR
jgi:MFS transporter, FHS family, glucose/mannose:H+ symporter